MKRHLVTTLAAAVLVAGILLVFVSQAPHAAQPAAQVEAPNAQAAAPNLAPGAVGLEGSYSGAVRLDWVLQGTPGALQTPTPAPTRTPGPSPTAGKTPAPTSTPELNLGEMELGLLLRSSEDGSVSGYVDLAASQVFTVAHTIMVTPVVPVGTVGPGYAPTPSALGVGPKVDGSFDGTTLRLQSEKWQEVTGTGLALMRRISLVGHKVAGSTGAFEGEYQETYWGFTKPGESVTMVGRFKLVQPSFTSGVAGEHKLYLPLIRR